MYSRKNTFALLADVGLPLCRMPKRWRDTEKQYRREGKAHILYVSDRLRRGSR